MCDGVAMKLGGFWGSNFLAAAIFCLSTQVVAQTVVNIPVGDYATVVSRDDHAIEGAIVEKVHLYAQKSDMSKEKIMRNGLLVRYANAVGTVLICHGFMSDKYDAGILRRLFPRGRYNIMSFDFRGHGENSQGQQCTFGKNEPYEVIAASNFLQNYPALQGKPLFAYGFSMGAVSVIEAQAKDSNLFKAVILDCPFDSSENIMQRTLDGMKFSLLGYEFKVPGRTIMQKYAFHPYVQSFIKMMLKTVAQVDAKNIDFYVYPIKPDQSVKKITIPMFIVHCKNDDKVTISAAKSIYNNAASAYKKLWITNGRRHYDSYFYSPERYTTQIRKFLDDAVSGSLYTAHKEEIMEDKNEDVVIDG
jgi:pimeloyl-ACP methyl ester carboxylesterase